MDHAKRAAAQVGLFTNVSRSGVAFLLAGQFALASPAQAVTWEIEITAPAYAVETGDPLGSRVFSHLYDPANLDYHCDDNACSAEGNGIFSFGTGFARTQIDGTILHGMFLTPGFLIDPQDSIQVGGTTIGGGAGGWSWTFSDADGPREFFVESIAVSQVGEPGTLALLGLGLAGLGAIRRRRKA